MITVQSRLFRWTGRLLSVALLAMLVAVSVSGGAMARGSDGGVGTLTPKDVYIRDDAADVGLEPNSSGGGYWNSPDVKACPTTIECATSINPSAYTTNYLFVKLRNPGPYGSGTDVGTLRVYLTFSGGAAVWPADWTSLNSAIVTVPPGITTVMLPWTTGGPGFVSTLYRWVSPDDPMLYEGPNAYQNTQFNNNVAWKNFNII